MSLMNERRSVGILGTGDFARALAKRLYFSGYDVTMGSRQPEAKSFSAIDDCLCNTRVVSNKECIKSVSIIFLAVHVENFKDLLDDHVVQLNGKILIDVSNRDRPNESISNAEYLQNLVSHAIVVKAFNVISAYSMENEYDTCSKQVFIASNSETARNIVAEIAKDMNFRPVDFGRLAASRKIESHPLRLFPEWRGPFGFAVAILNVWLIYLIYIYYFEKNEYQWDQIFIKVFNKAVCMTGITVLSVTYLASSVAVLFQIYYGTKHVRFPRWLDKWLRNRKQLGLVSFGLVSLHVIMSVLTMSATYHQSWYHNVSVTIPANLTQPHIFSTVNWMTWKGEAACLAGIFSFMLLCCICAATFQSVSDTLNWREWRFVQSKLGHTALFFAVVHVLVMGIPGWVTNSEKIYKSITFLSSVLPWTTLIIKMTLSMPCINRHIRKGWKKSQDTCKAKCTKQEKNGYVAMNTDNVSENSSRGLCFCANNAIQMSTIEENTNLV